MRAPKLSFTTAVFCSLFFIGCLGSSNFPADVPRCHFGDTSCIISTTTNLVGLYARTGYPAAAFPVIEPFSVKSVDISDGHGGSLSLTVNFKNVKVEGLSGVKVDRVVGFGADPSTSKFEMYGSFPKLVLSAKYTAGGRILVLPISGDGDADIVLGNPKFSVKFKPSTQLKNGKHFMTVDKLKVLVEPRSMQLKLTNLFNGDPTLGANMNQFLNENWQDVWNELQPSIHAAIAEIVKSILATMFKKYAYEDLFLED